MSPSQSIIEPRYNIAIARQRLDTAIARQRKAVNVLWVEAGRNGTLDIGDAKREAYLLAFYKLGFMLEQRELNMESVGG